MNLSDWSPCGVPDLPPMDGTFVRVTPLSIPDEGFELFAAVGGPENDDLWHYIPFGPFESAESLMAVLAHMRETQGWKTHVFRCAKTDALLGMSSYMRIRPEAGSAEVGCVVFSKALKRTPAASEAMFFMARHLFDDLGYRRYEWKCDNDNLASRSAASRFGFTWEGVFRQDMVVKGRNRDTAWFSMLDTEWPRIRSAYARWLSPENFDPDGQQRRALADVRNEVA